jgi:hypothetical protein
MRWCSCSGKPWAGMPETLKGFELSRRGPRVPTVLSRKECLRLLEAMEGTARLMAELMHVMNRPGLGIRSPLDARES